MSNEAAAAVIGALALLATNIMAWLNARGAKREVNTGNGQTLAQKIESMKTDQAIILERLGNTNAKVDRLADAMWGHVTDDERHHSRRITDQDLDERS